MTVAQQPKMQWHWSETVKPLPVIVAAAGRSSRMQGTDKQFLPLGGIPVLVRTLQTLETSPAVSRIIVVTRPESILPIERLLQEYSLRKVTDLVPGGESRQASVLCGLDRLTPQETAVLIQDGARPFVTHEMLKDCAGALDGADAALCAIKINDTVKRVGEDGTVRETLDRSQLYAAQTPQGVRVPVYRRALEQADLSALTDDVSAVEQIGGSVAVVPGSVTNLKITSPQDLELAEALVAAEPKKQTPQDVFLTQSIKEETDVRIGHGYDVHRLVEGRPLILGGVTVPYERGLLGHSDADVLLHAICDALLGAAALGDIGQHFPDTDPRYAGADSRMLLRRTAALVSESGFTVENVDATVLAQRPKLSPYLESMRQTIADDLQLPLTAVSVKATTEEGLGFTGSGEGIAAHAVCLLR